MRVATLHQKVDVDGSKDVDITPRSVRKERGWSEIDENRRLAVSTLFSASYIITFASYIMLSPAHVLYSPIALESKVSL